MKINELIFQGSMGQRAPVKLSFKDGVNQAALPAGLTMRDIDTIFTALFYPSRLTRDERERVEVGGPHRDGVVARGGAR